MIYDPILKLIIESATKPILLQMMARATDSSAGQVLAARLAIVSNRPAVTRAIETLLNCGERKFKRDRFCLRRLNGHVARLTNAIWRKLPLDESIVEELVVESVVDMLKTLRSYYDNSPAGTRTSRFNTLAKMSFRWLVDSLMSGIQIRLSRRVWFRHNHSHRLQGVRMWIETHRHRLDAEIRRSIRRLRASRLKPLRSRFAPRLADTVCSHFWLRRDESSRVISTVRVRTRAYILDLIHEGESDDNIADAAFYFVIDRLFRWIEARFAPHAAA